MAPPAQTPAPPGAPLDRIRALVDEARGGATLPEPGRADALATATALLAADGDTALVALTGYAADLTGAVAVELAAHPPRMRRLIERLESEAGIPRVVLARELLRASALLELGPERTLEVQLALLRAFMDATSMSLWTSEGAEPRLLAGTSGEREPEAATQPGGAGAVAQAALFAEARRPVAAATWLALRVRAPGAGAAVVAGGVRPGDPGGGPLLAAAAPGLAAALTQRPGLREPDDGDRDLIGALERRLARLRFDLHDGPQQDVHLLAQDLRLFRDQLRPLAADSPERDRVLGRIDDLEAQVVALDGDLRRLSTSVQSPLLAGGSLPSSLAQLTAAFAERTHITPRTEIEGDLSRLTDSQQIALLSLIRESLSNIRQHSHAEHVTIAVSAGAGGVAARITDDGIGFDPEETLLRAARARRLGLVGMQERLRMLGGRTQIESRPGGPTVISATLPPYPAAL